MKLIIITLKGPVVMDSIILSTILGILATKLKVWESIKNMSNLKILKIKMKETPFIIKFLKI